MIASRFSPDVDLNANLVAVAAHQTWSSLSYVCLTDVHLWLWMDTVFLPPLKESGSLLLTSQYRIWGRWAVLLFVWRLTGRLAGGWSSSLLDARARAGVRGQAPHIWRFTCISCFAVDFIPFELISVAAAASRFALFTSLRLSSKCKIL